MSAEERLFTEGHDELLDALQARGAVLKLRKGEVVIRKGREQGDLYVILSGQMHVVDQPAQGPERFLCALGAGDSFGEVSLLDAGPASATLRCLTACRVLRIGRKAFERFLNEDPTNGCRLLLRLGEVLSRRLRRMNDRVVGVWSAYVQSIP